MNNRYKGFSLSLVLVIVTITSIISALTTGIIVYNNNKLSSKLTYTDLAKDEELNQFLKVYANIISEYYEDIDKEELLEKAIAAMMNYLGDDYTTYLDNTDTNDLITQLAGEYKGIGIAINNSTKIITEVFEDTPAEEAGIMSGDIIITVDGENVENLTASETVKIIKEKNNDFVLELKRGEEKIEVNLKNKSIISPSISYKIIDNTKTGYLYIETFSNTLEEQIRKALNKMETAGMESLIIDLRNNTGGYLEAANKVTSLFTEKGKKIYSLEYKNEITHFNDETDEKRDYEIIVLVNKNTASASEVMAAALRDSYGAKIIGETSFGKGKVQQTMKLEDGSMVKYTSAYWLTPKGICIDKKGIIPDYSVNNEEIKDEDGNIIEIIDTQLEKALSVITNSSDINNIE